MKRNNKKLYLITTITILLIMCVGCKSDNKEGTSVNTEATSEAINDRETTAEENNTELTTETLVGVSNNWEDMQFTVDGKPYTLATSYQALNANGWHVDYEGCKYGEDYMMEPGEYTLQSHDLFHEQYQENAARERFHITMSFENNKNEKLIWNEARVSSFLASISENTDITYEMSHPEIILANEITWGATVDEIKNAFGEPSSQKESQYQPKEYTFFYYSEDETKEMTLVVHEKYGLVQICLAEALNQ